MRYPIACLLLLAAAAPAAAQDAAKNAQPPQAAEPRAAPEKAKDGEKAKNEADDFDIAQFMKVFDKIFPAQPAPPPERLALARTTATAVFPDGTYATLFDELMSGMVDRILALGPADFGEKKGEGEAKPASLREALAKDDPHFEERMRITRRVIGEELVKLSGLLEPKLRDGLARSIARRFDERQLREINAFLATDSGKAFGSQTMRMWMDPDVMRSMMHTLPDLALALPGAIERLEKETAHLPKPKKKESEKAEEQDSAGGDAGEAEEEGKQGADAPAS